MNSITQVRSEGKADTTDLLLGRARSEGEQTALQEEGGGEHEACQEEEVSQETLRLLLMPGCQEERCQPGRR